MKPIHTPRLLLSPVDARNARELWHVLNSPDLRKYQDIPRLPLAEFERQVRARPRSLDGGAVGRYEWLVRAGKPAMPIGWISLRINDRARTIGEVGYSLVEQARGRGFATEALRAALEDAFRSTELEEMQACCVPDNMASRSVLERVGFREERLLRRGAVIRGRSVDVVLYRVHRAEWGRRIILPVRRRTQS